MQSEVQFAGFGGQGVMTAGQLLAYAGMAEGKQVVWIPSYGPEMRGGTANCTISLGDEEIASPIASEPDYLVVMNAPSLYTFQNRLARGGILFLNASIIEARPTRGDITFHAVPCAEMAEEVGNPRAANIVMMGAFLQKTGIIKPEGYLKSLETIMGSKKKTMHESNRKAFAAGFRFLESAGGRTDR